MAAYEETGWKSWSYGWLVSPRRVRVVHRVGGDPQGSVGRVGRALEEERAVVEAGAGDEVEPNAEEGTSDDEEDESNDDGDWPEKVSLFCLSLSTY